MKETWHLIEQIVGQSPLAEDRERDNVLSKLDYMLGVNALEYKYPLDSSGLTEEEFVVYREVVSALNEAKSFPEVKTDSQYERVVKDIFKATNNRPSKEARKHLKLMDAAYEDGDWKGVNTHLKHIEGLI